MEEDKMLIEEDKIAEEIEGIKQLKKQYEEDLQKAQRPDVKSHLEEQLKKTEKNLQLKEKELKDKIIEDDNLEYKKILEEIKKLEDAAERMESLYTKNTNTKWKSMVRRTGASYRKGNTA